MSRMYEIRVSESRVIKVHDGVCSTIEMLPILSKERMSILLSEELKGFEKDGDSVKKEDDKGIVTEINLKTGEIKVSIHKEESIETEGVSRNDTDYKSREKQIKKEISKKLNNDLDKREESKNAEATIELEKNLPKIRKEIDEAINRATIRALKEKASQMGEIERIYESENGEMTIEVKV